MDLLWFSKDTTKALIGQGNYTKGNKDRDKLVTKKLRKMGWKVVRVWEHELKVPARVAAKLKKIINKNRK